jgi:hypothetical protein
MSAEGVYHMKRRLILAGLMAFLLGATLGAQPFPSNIQIAINQLVTGVTPFTAFRTVASSYLNWGTTQGTGGYGLRDNAGTIQVKNSGGSWANVQTSASTITAAPFITRTLDSNLSNEFALGSLGTALLVNTTTTGVPTAYGGTFCTNQFVTALDAVGAATCASVSLATVVTGTLPVANGGTGITSGTSGGVLAYTASGVLASSGALTVSRIVLGGGAGAAPTVLGSLGTTTTLLHGNAAGAPTFSAVSLTADVSGILPVANGGTNNAFFTVSGPAASAKTYTFPNASSTVLTSNAAVTAAQGGTGIASYTIGDLIQASATTTLAKLAAVSTGNVLLSGGVGTISAWGKVGLATHVSGTLGVTNGGTGLITYTQGDILYASAAAALAGLPSVSAGSYLRSAGVAANPVWSTLKLPNSAVIGDLMMASSTDTYTALADVSTGQVLVSGGVGVVPAYSANPSVTTVTASTSVTTPIVGNASASFRARTDLAVPTSLAAGDWWAACTGVVGVNRQCVLSIRDTDGITYSVNVGAVH